MEFFVLILHVYISEIEIDSDVSCHSLVCGLVCILSQWADILGGQVPLALAGKCFSL